MAATALAAIALINAAQKSDRDAAAAANRSVNRLHDRLGERFEQLERRVDRLPQSSDLQKLQQRLLHVEDRAGQAAGDAATARDSIGKLQDRVEEVEQPRERLRRSPGAGGADDGSSSQPRN